MTLIHQGREVRDAGYLLEDHGADFSRENIVLAQDAEDHYIAGTVLKKDGTAYTRFDGSGEPAGILYATTDATEGAAPAVASVRLTVFRLESLVWDDAVTTEQQATALEAMTSRFLIGRESD